MIVIGFIECIYNKLLNNLLFLIPAFFQIVSLLFYLEILEFNFCNLNKNTKRNIMLREEEEMLLRNNTNTKRNIMLREEEEMLLRNNTNVSEIEIDKDLIVKNPTVKKELELNTILNDLEEKDDDNEH